MDLLQDLRQRAEADAGRAARWLSVVQRVEVLAGDLSTDDVFCDVQFDGDGVLRIEVRAAQPAGSGRPVDRFESAAGISAPVSSVDICAPAAGAAAVEDVPEPVPADCDVAPFDQGHEPGKAFPPAPPAPVAAPIPPAPVTGPFSKAERSQFGSLAAEGKTAAEIAKVMNRRVQTIATKLHFHKKRGVTEKPAKAVRHKGADAPKHPAGAALCGDGLWRGSWSTDEENTLVKMAAAGHPTETIAARVCRPVSAVAKMRQILGVRIREMADASKPTLGEDPAPVQPVTRAHLRAYLRGVSVDGVWTPAKDFAFVQLIAKGAGVAGAGACLKVGRDASHARFGVLTQPLTDKTDLTVLVEMLEERITSVVEAAE